MPRTRSRKKVERRLKVRQASATPPKSAAQGAFTMPGSQNPHKSASLSSKMRQNKKGS